jgi:hypothetical protein
MDSSAPDRAELLARLTEVLGPKHAATLMENLHPEPWSELVTKGDLNGFEERLDLRFTAQTAQLEALVRERIDAQTKLLVFSLIGAVLTAAGIAIGSAAI